MSTFYDTITLQNFKDRFKLEFIQLLDTPTPFDLYNVYNSETSYATDDVIYNVDNLYLYKSLSDSNIGNTLNDVNHWIIQTSALKEKFFLNEVILQKISFALLRMDNLFDHAEDEIKREAFLLLVAYYLTANMNAFGFDVAYNILTSRSLAGASASYELPMAYKNNILYLNMAKNYYGKLYIDFIALHPNVGIRVVKNRNTYDVL